MRGHLRRRRDRKPDLRAALPVAAVSGPGASPTAEAAPWGWTDDVQPGGELGTPCSEPLGWTQHWKDTHPNLPEFPWEALR